ncbi:methyltransferase domain [Gottschalkia purinilytica]|uniref:Methyltransferase domain n=1 Tax=Gottschalkia purinilytica TaxID=1503 RepID=A0A0L0WES3_GOTPU|nr:SAM-dependent methyltransferase [Gottschalkia purinilytica]KNF09972.1 methyltransferase domain [Gottschalkia purinilytica]
MKDLNELLNDVIENEKMIYGVLSNQRKKDNNNFIKVNLKPVLIKGEKKIQFTYEYNSKVMHKNLGKSDSIEELDELLKNYFKQGMFFAIDADYQVLISKKGKVNILKKKPTKEQISLSHNRKKEYIINEGTPCDFLIRLGIMNESGKVYNKKYDKFKQINRFLEIVSDIVPHIKGKETFNIIDFGCGKSYLTFALYYYFVKILKLNVNIIGLDLKSDVIEFCNNVAKDLNYNKLRFIHGDIKDFDDIEKVNMIVTLHACDTATDAALAKAVNWNTDIILSVPCCQHELFKKINSSTMKPMLKHGIIKEKLSSLITDSLRANLLEILGYSTQLLEFIDVEHTPKNILIRSIKSGKIDKSCIDEYKSFKEAWGIKDIYLEKALEDKLKDMDI